RATPEEPGAGLAGGRHRGLDVGGARVGEGRHGIRSPATARTAATMFGYAPHRQRFPLMRSRISSSVSATAPRARTSAVTALTGPAGASSSRAPAEQI